MGQLPRNRITPQVRQSKLRKDGCCRGQFWMGFNISVALMIIPQARLEGEYRGGVARAGREAEEIAYVGVENCLSQLMRYFGTQLLRWWEDGKRYFMESILEANEPHQHDR